MSTTEPPKRGRPATGRMPQRQIRVPDEEWGTFKEMAAESGISVSEWIRRMIRNAIRRGLK